MDNPAAPVVAGVLYVFVGEQEIAVDPSGIAEIDRGMHRLRVVTERYLPAGLELDVEGFGHGLS